MCEIQRTSASRAPLKLRRLLIGCSGYLDIQIRGPVVYPRYGIVPRRVRRTVACLQAFSRGREGRGDLVGGRSTVRLALMPNMTVRLETIGMLNGTIDIVESGHVAAAEEHDRSSFNDGMPFLDVEAEVGEERSAPPSSTRRDSLASRELPLPCREKTVTADEALQAQRGRYTTGSLMVE